MSYTIRVGGDDIQARLVNQAQRVTIRLGQSALLWSDW